MPEDPDLWNIGFKFKPEAKPATREVLSDREIFLSYDWVYKPTQVFGGQPISLDIKEEDDFEVETVKFANGAFTRIPKEPNTGGANFRGFNYCQDVGALVLDKDGMITDFALADGITMTTNGTAAARRAAFFGVSVLRSDQVKWSEDGMKKMLLEVEGKMQDFDVEKTRLKWAETVRKDSRMGPGMAENLLNRMGYVISDGKLIKQESEQSKEYGAEIMGSTTLTLGHLEGNNLHMVYAADGGYIVVSRSGVVKVYGGEHERSAPPQLSLAGRKVPESDIKYVKLELSAGDVVMVFTDGLYHGNGEPKEIARRAADLLKQGQSLEQISEELLQNSAGSDDNSLLVFTYKG